MAPVHSKAAFKHFRNPKASRRAPQYNSKLWDQFWNKITERLRGGMTQGKLVKEIKAWPDAINKGFKPTLPQLERQLRNRSGVARSRTRRPTPRDDRLSASTPTTPTMMQTIETQAPAAITQSTIETLTALPMPPLPRTPTSPRLERVPSMSNGSSIESFAEAETPLGCEATSPTTPFRIAAIHYPPSKDEVVGNSALFEAVLERDQWSIDIQSGIDSLTIGGSDLMSDSFVETAEAAKRARPMGAWSVDEESSICSTSNSSWSFGRTTGMGVTKPTHRQPLAMEDVAAGFVRKGSSAEKMHGYIKQNPDVLRVEPEIFFEGAMIAAGKLQDLNTTKCISCMNVLRAKAMLQPIPGSFTDFMKALVANQQRKASPRQKQIANNFWISCNSAVDIVLDMRNGQHVQRASMESARYLWSNTMARLPDPVVLAGPGEDEHVGGQSQSYL